MPISKDEAGLPQAQYDALTAAYEKGSYRFIAHRANLQFAFQDIGMPDVKTDDFYAVYAPEYEYVLYAVNGTLYVHALDPATTPAPSPASRSDSESTLSSNQSSGSSLTCSPPQSGS